MNASNAPPPPGSDPHPEPPGATPAAPAAPAAADAGAGDAALPHAGDAAAAHLAAMRALAPLPWMVRVLLLAFACASLVTGVIGIFVPGLPTTVFVLMAAWAAARSSPRLYGWLVRHRLFGPMIINWHNGGTVSRKAKWSASVTMLACAVIVAFTAQRWWLAAFAIGSMAAVSLWLWRRPEPG